jgi:putative PEP-CTERM system TPR-repeat lipoprotein
MEQAKTLSQEGNHRGALVVYKTILEKHPDDVPALMASSEAYLHLGKVDQAASTLDQVTKIAADAPGLPLLTARVRNTELKPDLALAAVQPLLDGQTASAEVWEQAGLARLLKGQLPQAQENYEKALALSEHLVKARLGLIECFLQEKQMDKAKAQLDTLLTAAPNNRDGLYLLVRLHVLNNDEDGIIETYGKIGKYYPDDLRARYSEAFLRLGKKQDVDYVQTVAADLLEKYPKAAEGYKLKGLVALAKGDNAQAVTSLMEANKWRQDLDTQIFLAQAYTGMGNLETAASYLQAALSAKPDLALPRRMLAAIYLRQNRVDEAISETQKLLEKSPDDTQGERILGDALVAKREFDKGLEVFSRLAEQKGQSPVVHIKKGSLLAMRGEDAAAEKELRTAVELGGDQLEPRMYLAALLASKNRLDEAVDILGAIKENTPGAALGYNAMSKLRLRQGQLAQAKEMLEKAKRVEPSLLVTYYNLAVLHIAAGELDKAAAEYEAALAIMPTDLRAIEGASGCWEAMGDMAKAQALLEQAAKSKSPQASIALAKFYGRRTDTAKALEVLEQCLTNNPGEIPVWLLKSQLLAASGDQAKALAALDRVESLDQRLGFLEKAKYYLAKKNPDKAFEMAGKLRDMNRQSGAYALPLAEIQQLTGQPAAAKETLLAALREDPGNVQVLTLLADVDSQMHNAPAALATMDKAIAAGMDPATAYAMKGVFLQRASDLPGAMEQYEKALRFKDTQVLALNNLAMLYADRKGDEAKALDLAMRACSVQAGNALMLDTLGYALLKNGRVKDGQAVLERAKRILPDNKDIDNHLNMARELASKQQS